MRVVPDSVSAGTAQPLPAEVDVLIVGYGPVGATLAGLLGRYGVRTLVVDRAPAILNMPRAIALDNEALRILQLVGLADDAFDKCVIPQVRMLCPYVGEFGRIATDGELDAHPKLVTFYQPELEQALRKHAESMPAVTAQNATGLVRFSQHKNHVQAVLETASGDQFEVSARFLIGADGANSDVRKAIGEDFDGETYTEDWLVVDAFGVPGTFDHVEFICDPKRPTPHMVAPGGRTRWEFMLQPGETREQMESEAAVTQLLSTQVDIANIRIERQAVYRFHARACNRFSKGRVFLAGDAAHITPPFVGQGLVSGLRDAANLAWKLAWVLKELASPTILTSYDEERLPHAAKMINLAKNMGKLVMPRNHLQAIAIHGTMMLLRKIPAVRLWTDELGAKPQNAFENGLFIPRARHGLQGQTLPQTRMGEGSPQGQRSDDILGDSLALVSCDGDPAAHLTETTAQLWQNIGGRSLVVPDLHSGFNPPKPSWCYVVRPDRVILHEGPVQQADSLVQASLRLLGTPAAAQW